MFFDAPDKNLPQWSGCLILESLLRSPSVDPLFLYPVRPHRCVCIHLFYNGISDTPQHLKNLASGYLITTCPWMSLWPHWLPRLSCGCLDLVGDSDLDMTAMEDRVQWCFLEGWSWAYMIQLTVSRTKLIIELHLTWTFVRWALRSELHNTNHNASSQGLHMNWSHHGKARLGERKENMAEMFPQTHSSVHVQSCPRQNNFLGFYVMVY